jgi:thioredoxin reductase (NADPH)
MELLARGRAEAESYGVQILPGRATSASGGLDDFTVDVDGGKHRVHARRVILASGLIDDLPDIPGVREAWGVSVLHCPFCHGWEVRDQRIAILTRDEVAIHHAMLFRQLTNDVTLFLHEAADPTDEQWDQLAALGVRVVRPRISQLIVDEQQVKAVEIEGGHRFEMDAAIIAPRYNARTELYEELGGEATPTPFGQQIAADSRGGTAIPGVFTAGNSGEPMAMLVASTASGVTTGSAVHGSLAFADLNRAVERRR